MKKEKYSIGEWAEEDRPREKMVAKGVEALSNAELLAILIRCGNSEQNAVELMRVLLQSCDNSLDRLGKLSLDRLSSYKGIGKAKALAIMAASELGKRRRSERPIKRGVISCAVDVYRYFQPLLCDSPVEKCFVMILNQANKILETKLLSTGGMTGTAIDIRLLYREALVNNGCGIILCHNHPSGNTEPSRQDDLVTGEIARAGKAMNIPLLDHVIVCSNGYYSYADRGRII